MSRYVATNLVTCLFLATWWSWNGHEAAAQSVYRFDAGSTESVVDSGAVRITPDDSYTPGRGYGWTEAPAGAFTRANLDRSRNAFTRDGVSAQRLGFRADVSSGIWWVTLWLESGLEDSSSVEIVLGNERRKPDWMAFLPPAEGRENLQKIYRVYHGRTHVEENVLQFTLAGGRDSVRVLGFTLHPDPGPVLPEHRALLQHLETIGKYTAAAALDSIGTGLDLVLDEIEVLLKRNPDDIFASYWREQVELLHTAEEYIRLMGWEWVADQTGLGIFDRYHGAVMLLDALLDRPDLESYPLYERALWQRGRLLYWLGLERHGPHEMEGAEKDLAALYRRYPNDPLLAMYNGEKIDVPDACDSLVMAPGAPEWSIAQREVNCRLRLIAHWWINERQISNGELGGKLGDDVELLRWWPPLILGGDSTVLKGWKRLADGIWNSDEVYLGYAKDVGDVEHASEFISDTAPPMVLFTDEPEYIDRLRYSAEHFENLWTGLSTGGRRFFRSSWFSATEIDTLPPKNRDVEMNTRAVKAIRYLAWKTLDPHVIELLQEWSEAWVDLSLRTDKGKPPGIIPASIRFPDEAINGEEPDWHAPNMYWDYYDWDHNTGSMMLDQLLFTYTLTRNERLLEPVRAHLDLIVAQQKAGKGNTPPEKGSAAWAAEVLSTHSDFWSVVDQWRLQTGKTDYDSLILKYGTPYTRYRITGESRHLTEGLEPLLETIRYNTPLLTTEVLHTDRVYVSPRNSPGTSHLNAMLTGDGTPDNMSPYPAVSWEDTDVSFTALVAEAGSRELEVHVYSHADVSGEVRMRVWQLEPGTYRVTQKVKGAPAETSQVVIREKGQRLPLNIPPQNLVQLIFSPAG